MYGSIQFFAQPCYIWRNLDLCPCLFHCEKHVDLKTLNYMLSFIFLQSPFEKAGAGMFASSGREIRRFERRINFRMFCGTC